ncbi:MAG: cytidine deaminase [Firmicutes bacterium ML8_F2]|nr:MAG: cytidine deaminase [Firmicutes bacterium ML8_F2]
MERPTWDEIFMAKAGIMARRSTCLRRQVGAVIAVNNREIASGYNGAIAKTPHCDEVGCKRETLNIPSGERQEICRANHAEANALLQCALTGVIPVGGTIYITCQPCVTCAKLIAGAGLKRVVYAGDYPDRLALEILSESNIAVERYN